MTSMDNEFDRVRRLSGDLEPEVAPQPTPEPPESAGNSGWPTFKPCTCDAPHDGICKAATKRAASFFQQYCQSRGVESGYYSLSFDQWMEFATCFAAEEIIAAESAEVEKLAAPQGVGKLSPEPLCVDCKHLKNDARFHFDAPGDNWGAALHWFKPPKGGVEGVGQTAREWRCYHCNEVFIDPEAGEHFGSGEYEALGMPLCVSELRSDEKVRLHELRLAADKLAAAEAQTLTLRAELQQESWRRDIREDELRKIINELRGSGSKGVR